MRLPKLKLVHQILIVVSIPLLSQLLFVVMLESLWQTTRLYSKQAIQYKDMLLQYTIVRQDVRAISTSLSSNGRVFANGDGGSFVRDGAELLECIEKGARSDYETRNIIDMYRELKSVLQAADAQSGGISPAIMTFRLRQFESELNHLMEREKVVFERDSKTAKQSQEHQQRLVAFGLVLNIVLCPCLVLFLSYSLSSRLSGLIANSERLKEGKELHAIAGGDDEIAHLETVFQDMAQSLTTAKQSEKQFVAMVSHDLRTPLNSVLATLNLLSDGKYGELSERGQAQLKSSEESIARLVRLTDELLEMERLASGKVALQLSAVPLQELIESSIEEVRGFADYKDVSIQHDKSDAMVSGDRDRLIQVFVNLLSNAIKFTPDRSTVELRVANAGDSMVEVCVVDEGPGVPPGSEARVFDPFEQLGGDLRSEHAEPERVAQKRAGQERAASERAMSERAASELASPESVGNEGSNSQGASKDRVDKNGSGMGLAICKAIVQQHGGSIGVRSRRAANGAEFWVRLRRVSG